MSAPRSAARLLRSEPTASRSSANRPHTMPSTHTLRRLPRALSLSVLAWAAASALAQTQPATGSPTDVRYTPVTGPESALYPRQPGDAVPSAVLGADRNGIDFAANAAVARLVVEVDRNAVPADGQSPVKVTVRVYGRDDKPLEQPVFVTFEHSGGRVLLPGARTDEFGPRSRDADRVTPGVQIKVEGGLATFTLLAPAEAQDVRLVVTAGAAQVAGSVSFVPEMREMIAAGLIEGIVNFKRGAQLQPTVRRDGFEQELEHWSRQFNSGKANVAVRTAFYLKGTVRGDLLLTAAYDSDKETRERLLRDVNPDEFYPVFGDASLRSFDARSGSRLYVRVDKNKSYALWGDFVTGDGFSQPIGQGSVASLKQRSLGNYNRSATGLRLHHEVGALTANAFVINDTLKQVVEEFASQGSGPYRLTNNAVLEGSEKVEVIVRDRYQPSRIVAVKPLARLADYTFEPFSGRILLTQFLGAFDDNLNPVSLRISYEVDQGGTAFWSGGVDGQLKLGEQVEIGGSAVKDQNPFSPYELLSANATWRIAERTALVVEAARSTSVVNTNPVNQSGSAGLAGVIGGAAGNAWRVELVHEGDKSDARLFAGRSDPTFNNPAAPLQGGRSELQFNGGYRLAESFKLYGDASQTQDRNEGGGKRLLAGLGLRWFASERLTLDLGVRAARETIGTLPNSTAVAPFGNTGGLAGSIASGSAGGALGYGSQAIDPGTGLAVIGASLLTPAQSDLPVGTRLASDTLRLGAGYKVTDRFQLGAEIEGEFNGDKRRRVALGGDYQFAERTRLYGRLEHQTGWSTLGGVSTTNRSANVLVAGVDTSYLKDTQLFSEYRLRDAISGRDLQLASGIRHNLDLAEGLRASAAYEQINVLSGNTARANAVALGLEYTADPLWRGSTRLEVRRAGDIESTPDDETFTTALWQVMAARKLDRDWTLLARNYLLRTDYRARGDVLQDRAQLGVAYRDTDTNRVNALAKVEYKLETDGSNAAVGTLKSRAWIVSTHADYHPSRPWWLTGRFAAKWQADRFENGVPSSFAAKLLAGRVVYDVTENWDVGLLGATTFGQYGARQYAAGVEVGYLLQQNLWLSAGYNATGFKGDADLTGYEYTQRGAYLRLRFKFDETLFRRGDREINRTLDR
jgi:hypothetical protein